MLEGRVARLEEDMRSVKETLSRIETAIAVLAKDMVEVRTKLAFIEGRLQGMPSTWQLLVIVLTTWSLGTALLFGLLRYAGP